jgi:hypothetical protein
MKRLSLAVLILVLTGACSSPSAPSEVTPTPEVTSAAGSPVPSESVDCQNPPSEEEFEKSCVDPDQEVVLPDPVSFKEPYFFEDGLKTEVTKITHPDKDSVALLVKVTNSANRDPENIEVAPSANFSYSTKKNEKLDTKKFPMAYSHGPQAVTSFQPPLSGKILAKGEAITTTVTFKVPAKSQDHVVFNFAISPDYQWCTFVGSVS